MLEENLSARERVCRMIAVCEHHTATRSDWSVRAGLSSLAGPPTTATSAGSMSLCLRPR